MSTDVYEAPAMNGQHPEPRPPKTRKRQPTAHTDPVTGRMVLAEALTTLEGLEAAERTAPHGPEQRNVANRRYVWQLFVEQLEAFHGDEV